MASNSEADRLADPKWRTWGPYLSERQWGTVREDYSPDGTAWDYLPHDMARSRAYRWGEDGILGISDDRQVLCFSVAMWNHKDPILKERLFGLTNEEGNHGEDVKELYFYLDSTPSHSYMKGLYKYPQAAYPYQELIETNKSRGQLLGEYEIWHTQAFAEQRYFDILVEYAKEGPEDIAIRITVTNHGTDTAPLSLLPQTWYRNRWAWHPRHPKQTLRSLGDSMVEIPHERIGTYYFSAEGSPQMLFTENETNMERLFGVANHSPFVKDAFHRYIVGGEHGAVNPSHSGSKCGALYEWVLQPGESKTVHLRLGKQKSAVDASALTQLFTQRQQEADQFYSSLNPGIGADALSIQRQAFAGLLWSKQYYHYNMHWWLDGDPLQPSPPPGRRRGRNHSWRQFDAAEVLSMPDKWEYPWFAAWDLAFHMIPFALIDPAFAKAQLTLLTREWYMHPNGQIPAYEWNFSDVNPPVHAWAAWRVYTIERRITGKADRGFLVRMFHKLLLNFTWWVNRKDSEGNNVFEGGFLGLDNIGVFDRNVMLPDGTKLEQSDGTSWMGMFCLNMLTIALELAIDDPAYEDVATKFLEHFFFIAEAMNNVGDMSLELWDEEDGFYYDLLRHGDMTGEHLKVRSWVGLIPIFAVTTLDADVMDRYPGFQARLDWFLKNKPDCMKNIASVMDVGMGQRRLLSLIPPERLRRVLRRVLDESEFYSPYGVRAISKFHHEHPYQIMLGGEMHEISYQPAESLSTLFGGNSNWRGPIWFPLNYLLIESLQNLDYYYGPDFMVECPSGSGYQKSLAQVASDLEMRLLSIFQASKDGERPCHQGIPAELLGGDQPAVLFNEYFDGDTGRGLGASHQTGWTGLIAKIIQQALFTMAKDRGNQERES